MDSPAATATAPAAAGVRRDDDALAGKSPELRVCSREPLNGGPPPALQAASFLTPNELFFVRNHAPVPPVDPAAYRLRVGGLVERPLELSLAALAERFERAELVSTLVCAGQRRLELMRVEPIPGELPWDAEAVSTARWSGWRLADVVAAAGPGPGAAHAGFRGLDEVERGGERFGFGGSVPLAKALAPEVLLADHMNGEPLPPNHGAPLRVVVPGYIGARSVKWLAAVELRERSSDNYFQARAYRLYPPGMRVGDLDPEQGFELGELSVSCLITEPLVADADGGAAGRAEVAAGRVAVRGFAYAGGGRPVRRVELSADGGATWTTARLDDGAGRGGDGAGWSWRLFTGEVDVAPGDGEIAARAWDAAGHTQPSDPAQLWNCKGYMNNAWSRVGVRAR
jgi:sulfite oxidase